MTPNRTQSLTRPTVSGLAVRAAGVTLGLAVAVFLARNLAAEDLGAYQVVLSIGGVVASLCVAAAAQPVSRRIAAMDSESSSELADEIGLAHLVVGFAMLALAFLLLAGSLLPAIPEATRLSLRYAALVAPGVAILSLRQWIALPLQGVAASLVPEQLGQPLVFLGVAGFVAHRSGLGPFEALAIYALVCWLVWLISSWRSGLIALLWNGLRRFHPGPKLRTRFREGRPFVALTTVSALPIYATVPIVAALLGLSNAGRLAIALQLTGLIAVPLQIVSLAVMPRCAVLHRDKEIGALCRLVRTACTISLALGMALTILLLVFLNPILRGLGPSFSAMGGIVSVIVLGQLVNAALGPNGPTLLTIGLEREVARVETVAMVLRLSGVAVAAATGSMIGVALAITAATMLRNVLLSATLYRRVGILTLPRFPSSRADHQ